MIGIFFFLIFSQTISAQASFSPKTPLFTRSHSLTAPATNSEPINLNWNGFTAQQVANYYISRGWDNVSKNSWHNIHVTFNFNPLKGPVGAYVIVENSGSVWIDESSIGGPSKVYNWNNVTFVRNSNNVAILSSACFINFAMPVSRDHFRIWQFGSNVIGSGTHDSGFESGTATYFEQLVGSYYSLFCGAAITTIILDILNIGLVTSILLSELLNLITVPITHYLIINPMAGSTGGHLVASYPNGWTTAKIVANNWASTSNHVVTRYRDTGISPTWTLTGRTQKWNYLSYDMGSTNFTSNFLKVINIKHLNINVFDLTLPNLFVITQIPIVSLLVIVKKKKIIFRK